MTRPGVASRAAVVFNALLIQCGAEPTHPRIYLLADPLGEARSVYSLEMRHGFPLKRLEAFVTEGLHKLPAVSGFRRSTVR